MTTARGKSPKKRGVEKGGAQKVEKTGARKVEKTADGRHVLIDGRRWRATNPNLPEAERRAQVARLMKARRDVGAALRAGDGEAELAARRRVHRAKVALGERGPKWWEEDGGAAKKSGRAAAKKSGSVAAKKSGGAAGAARKASAKKRVKMAAKKRVRG
jgi:uncharacterized protein